jgi:signal transduction histidine kinase
MTGIMLTSASVGYAAQTLLFLVIAYYLFDISKKSPPTWLMAIFFAVLSCGSLASFLAVSYSPWESFAEQIRDAGYMLAFIPITQFGFRYPVLLPQRKSEAKRGLLAAGFIAVYGVMFLLSYEITKAISAAPFILVALELLWLISILVRQTIYLSENPETSGWRRFIHPQTKEACTARLFAFLFAITFVFWLGVEIFIQADANPLRILLRTIGELWIFFAVALAYFNRSADMTTIIVKIVGACLMISLTALSVISFLLPSAHTILYAVVFSSLFIVFFLPVFLRLNLIRPLYVLLDGVARFNAGDQQTAVEIGYNDEVGTLTKSFNDMVNTIQIAARALRQANLDLEQKVGEQEQLLEELNTAHIQLQTVSRHLVETQENERRRLAGELHDEIGQALTGIKLTLELSVKKAAEPSDSLRQAQSLVSDLIMRVNDLSLNLRPVMLDEFGLLPALMYLVDNYTRQTGIEVFFQQNGLDDMRFMPETETAVYRIVQEALTNIARYAQVKEASVRILCESEQMLVEIEDHGVGFEMQPTNRNGFSYGLAGMMERATLIGGKMKIESAPNTGTFIWAKLPVHSRKENKS